MKYFGAKYGNKNVKIILVKKCPYVVMKYFGAKYGNKNVKIILVKKCPYVVMKYFGGKSCQATYPQGISLLLLPSYIGILMVQLLVECEQW